MTVAPPAPVLPPAAAELLRSVDDGSILGATRQLFVLGDALIDMAVELRSDPRRLATDVEALVGHVVRTRGASSQAVVNGLDRMTRPALQSLREPSDDADPIELLQGPVRAFREELTSWLASLRRHATSLLADHRSILAYDYSSTVAKVVADLAIVDPHLTVYVPEARSLDGGRKYLADWEDLDLDVKLVPDAALGWAVDRCDVAVVGAETLSASGGCYNTIGTSLLARESTRSGTPLYVLSVLLKTDLRAHEGERPSPMLDFLARLDAPISAGSSITVDGTFPDLDYADPDDIRAIVTERGAVSPDEVRALATSELALDEIGGDRD